MPKKFVFLLFLGIFACFLPVLGQGEVIFEPEFVNDAPADSMTVPVVTALPMFDWQEQILQQVDVDDLGEEAYEELIEQLSDLTLWSDTLAPQRSRTRQHLIWSSNRCLNERAGYQNATTERQANNRAYLGDPWHHSLRYRLRAGDTWQAGFNVEKDPGEAWGNTWTGFDSWHAYLLYRSSRPHDLTTVLGHYRLRLGCGLLMNQGFSLGKQYLTGQLLTQRSNTITPFASNAESGYMQGAAAELRATVGRLRLTLLPFVSLRNLDGTYHSDTEQISALQTDGMHRTTTEASHRNAVWQTVAGTRLGLRGEWYDVGINALYTHLQYDYRRNVLYYNHNYFRGHQLFQTSIDYHIRALGCVIRGEVAVDDSLGIANLTAVRRKWNSSWTSALVYRYYSRHYRQLHASALSENHELQGEMGVTLDVEGQLSRHWSMQAMADFFQFGQPQYGIRESTSQGLEASVRLQYQRRSSLTSALTYRVKCKGDYVRHQLDGQLQLQPSAHLQLRTQLRARIYSKEATAASTTTSANASFGYAASQSLLWRTRLPFLQRASSLCREVLCNKSPWGTNALGEGGQGESLQGGRGESLLLLSCQASYFDTDDYDSRIYLTERNVLYGFGLPMLYGRGLRYSITATLSLGRHFDIDLKYALTNYADRSTLSSGLQQIEGNTQHDLWLQLRLTY